MSFREVAFVLDIEKLPRYAVERDYPDQEEVDVDGEWAKWSDIKMALERYESKI